MEAHILPFLMFLWAHVEDIFAALFAVHAAAVVITRLTPTPKDDAIVAKVLKGIEAVASLLSVKRKDFPAAPSPGLY